MANILWISKSAPYNNVGHAGGKTHNFYIKSLNGVHDYKIILVSFCNFEEKDQLDLEKYGINNYICIRPRRKTILWYLMKFFDLESYLNPYDRYACLTHNHELLYINMILKKLKKRNYVPDLVILEWTQVILMYDKIKKYFPNAKFVGVEVDVAFLGYQRIAKMKESKITRFIAEVKYKKLKKIEIDALQKIDKIIVNNYKDRDVLINNCINYKKINYLPPYFDNYKLVDGKFEGSDIIFWGAMNREENWKSALWFIDNVMPLLSNIIIRFVVIGNKPNRYLLRRQNSQIVITGFVENPFEYFRNAICMVAPLLFGAGIKVKILEGLSTGIPVLTNDIGAEGIELTDKVNYYKCTSPKEYADIIKLLYNNREIAKKMGMQGKKFVEKNYNLSRAIMQYKEIINSLLLE